MKRYLVVGAILALSFLMCFVSGASLAQEEADYSWGVVSSISSEQIVVSEYNYDTDEYVNVAYVIDPKVKLNNVNSLDDIVVGETIEIDYVVRSGKRVAKIISVEKSSYEEEYTPSETYEEQPEYSPEEIEY